MQKNESPGVLADLTGLNNRCIDNIGSSIEEGKSADLSPSSGFDLDIRYDNLTTPSLNDEISHSPALRKSLADLTLRGKGKYRSSAYRTWRAEVEALLRSRGERIKADKFALCGKTIVMTCRDGCGNKKLVPFRCGLRVCPECQDIISRSLFFQVKSFVQDLPKEPGFVFRHIVFTKKPSGDLRADLQQERKALSRVRRWLKAQSPKAGALYGMEFGPKSLMLHTHMLVYAPWFDYKTLRNDVWREGGVEIRKVRSEKQIYNVCSYAIRFTDKEGNYFSPEKVVRIEKALRGFRRIGAFGCFYGKVRTKGNPHRKHICPCCGKLMMASPVYDIFLDDLCKINGSNREGGPPGG